MPTIRGKLICTECAQGWHHRCYGFCRCRAKKHELNIPAAVKELWAVK